MGIKQLYNDNLRKLPNKYGDVSVMNVITVHFQIAFFLSKRDRIEMNCTFNHGLQFSGILKTLLL